MSPEKRGLIAFLALTFGLTWFVEIVLLRPLSRAGMGYIMGLVGVMFIPGTCAVLVRLFVERRGFGDAGLRWGRGRWYLWAWLLLPAAAVAAMGLALLARQAEFDPYLTELMVKLHQQLAASGQQAKLPPIEKVRIYLIVGSLTQAVVMNLIPCFGEEFGWRGYLLMRLMPLGAGRAVVLTGAIWGLWHAPIILQGHNYPDHPRIGVLLMTTFCIALGIILGWLRLASGSVFPAALGHAAVNGPGSTPLAFLRARNDLTTGLTGLLGQAVLLTVALALWRLRPLRAAPHHIPSED